MTTHQNITKGIKSFATIGLASLLIACGGGGSAGSESVVARGVITALGSIWVNGVEYETPPGGSYSNDDTSSSTASFNVGQVVSIRGRLNDDGVSGTATEVEYEAEIEAAADSANTINGVTILIIAGSTNVSQASLTSGALNIGSRYEVSGFWLDDSTIEATFIKDDDDGGPGGDGIDEVKGYVEAIDSTSITLHGVKYQYSGASATFSVGDFVEIHFTSGTFVASQVQLEDDFFDNQGEGQEVEFEGMVNIDPSDLAACPGAADFIIDMTCIDWNANTHWSDGLDSEADLVSGIRVEVEGHVNAVGVLVAEEIKGRGNRVRALSIPIVTGAGTFDLFEGAIQVTTSAATELDDIPLSTLLAGGVEVRGIRTGLTSILATRIKTEDVPVERNELRAQVDPGSVDSSVSSESITLMGLTLSVNASTRLEIEDVLYTSTLTSFLDMIDDNDSIADGPRDIVDLRFNMSTLIADQIEIEIEND